MRRVARHCKHFATPPAAPAQANRTAQLQDSMASDTASGAYGADNHDYTWTL